MSNLKSFIGSPINFNNICFIYPPKIADMINNDNYFIYQKLLTITQEEIYDSLVKEPVDEAPHFTVPIGSNMAAPAPLKFNQPKVKVQTPLEYILANCYNNTEFLQIVQEAFQFFTHSDILPLYEEKAILIGDLDFIAQIKDLRQLPLLTNDNFLSFQNTLRSVLGFGMINEMDLNEDPRITRMKAKARYRDKIKAQSNQALNFESMLVAICCMQIGITPLNIGELSYCAAMKLFQMYQSKEKYELDTSSLLAGADPKKIKPKYWITNLTE